MTCRAGDRRKVAVSTSLSCHSLTVTRGERTVVDAVDLTLAPGHRVGVIGPNGIGKSTLLQALAGLVVDPTSHVSGSVTTTPPDATIGYLAQEPRAASMRNELVDGYVARRTGVADAQRSLDGATDALAAGSGGADDRYATALERWRALGAADIETRTDQVFADLGLPTALRDRPFATLSGGQAARVALASILLSNFDVVLLDEPTNDMDLDALDHLERWVVGLDRPLALVSHDRAFLERTITHVAEIDHHRRDVTVFAGGWQAYVDERARARDLAQQRYDDYDAKRRQLLTRAQRAREWSTSGAARVRRSDENDKHVRNFKMNQTEQLAGRAARTQQALDRLDEVESPRTAWQLRYEIPTAARSGDVVVTANAAHVERGDFQLGPLDLAVYHGDRIASVGPNGSGKATLLEMLLGRIEPVAGSVTMGASIVLGEIAQTRDELVGDEGLIDAFCAATGRDTGDARTLLAKFELSSAQLDRPGSTLSPGERTRAAMAVLMANGANLLVFDEPTNHLDLPAIEQLETALQDYAGTLLLVTHARSLLGNVRFTRVLSMTDGSLNEIDTDVVLSDETRHRG